MFNIPITYENILLIAANIINLIYNIPQMLRTYRTKSANDFDIWFLGLRIFYNFLWILYGIEINSILVVINSIVTILATSFISYYKIMTYLTNSRTILPITNLVDEKSNDGNTSDWEDEYTV